MTRHLALAYFRGLSENPLIASVAVLEDIRSCASDRFSLLVNYPRGNSLIVFGSLGVRSALIEAARRESLCA